MALVALDGGVAHGEIMLRIHGALFGLQITDMAVGRKDLKIVPQIFLDGLGFCR
ncbi:hypothetical protein GGI1_04542 [Acidithiobacillus sp. GGI-221]|nr:hypothetical protein GGI1_04542 [Acidithiobacillus sp. GGI-221]